MAISAAPRLLCASYAGTARPETGHVSFDSNWAPLAVVEVSVEYRVTTVEPAALVADRPVDAHRSQKRRSKSLTGAKAVLRNVR